MRNDGIRKLQGKKQTNIKNNGKLKLTKEKQKIIDFYDPMYVICIFKGTHFTLMSWTI